MTPFDTDLIAVGVDYAMFYLRREMEERGKGRSPDGLLQIVHVSTGAADHAASRPPSVCGPPGYMTSDGLACPPAGLFTTVSSPSSHQRGNLVGNEDFKFQTLSPGHGLLAEKDLRDFLSEVQRGRIARNLPLL